MVDVSTLSPGSRVKIVDEWPGLCGQNSSGEMDHFLGTIVTVDEICDNFFTLVEDEDHAGHNYRYGVLSDKWLFSGRMVECMADDIADEDIICDVSSLIDLVNA